MGPFSPQRGCELAGVDIVETAFDVKEERRNLGPKSLKEANLVGKGGSCVESGESRAGPCLMRMEQAHVPGEEGKAGGSDSFKYLGESFEEHNDSEGGGGVVRGLARFIQHNSIRLLQRRGMMSVL